MHIGGPTALIEIDGWRLLTDPTFAIEQAFEAAEPSLGDTGRWLMPGVPTDFVLDRETTSRTTP